MSCAGVYLSGLGLWSSLIALASPVPCDAQTNPPAMLVQQTVMNRLQVADYTIQVLEPPGKGELAMNIQLAGKMRQLVLQKHALRAPGFRVVAQDGAGAFREVPLPECRTYRGYVADCGGSSVTATITDGRVRAVMHLGDVNDSTWIVEPLQDLLGGAVAGRHVVYDSKQAGGEPGFCGNHDTLAAKPASPQPLDSTTENLDVLVCEIACDADYEYYTLNGSSVENTVADIETILNGVSAIFERDTRVSFQITQIIVRSAEPDPYDATTVDGLLSQFRLDWKNNHQETPRDIAHLFTGKSFGTVLGNSYTDQVCPGFNHYSLVRSRWQTDLGKRIALSAHEIGHSFDAYHCDYDTDPRCKIMCPNLGSCSSGYHSFEDMNVARIRAAAAGSPCLTAGTVATPVTTLPFADNFNNFSYPPQVPGPAKWTAADRAQCEYQRLEITIGRGYNFNQELGTVRTLPMQLSGPARVQYRVNPGGIPSSQSFKIEYFNSSSFTWQILRTITGDGSSQYRSYDDPVPASAAGSYFAVRFSAWGTAYTSSYTWYVDDVSITPIAVPPMLAIAPAESNTVVISWPQPATDWKLETTGPLTTGTGVWTLIPPPYPTNATQSVVTEPLEPGTRFYRLRTP